MACNCHCGCHKPAGDTGYELAILGHNIAYRATSIELRKHNPDGTRTIYWAGSIKQLCELLQTKESQ